MFDPYIDLALCIHHRKLKSIQNTFAKNTEHISFSMRDFNERVSCGLVLIYHVSNVLYLNLGSWRQLFFAD